MKVPLAKAYISQKEKDNVIETLESGWLAPGKFNKQLEQQFQEYLGVKHAITLNSCTSGLHLSVELNGIKGDVLVPSFTFVASANAIVTGGATPKFVEIEPQTRNMDPARLESMIDKNTEAIMPVHFGGLPCDMDTIMALANKYHLAVIEDSAETLGASYKGKMTGSFGIGNFSFFPTKNMTTAEGGMITTNDSALAQKIRAYIGHGIKSSTFEREKASRPWLRAASFPGYNFRMSNVHAAIGCAQMDKIEEMNDLRRAAAKEYDKKFASVDEISVQEIPTGRTHSYQMYTILIDPKVNRDQVVNTLNKKGVGASVHFDPPVHQHPAYESHKADLHVTEAVASQIITLPMYPSITQEELQYVVDQTKEAITYSRK